MTSVISQHQDFLIVTFVSVFDCIDDIIKCSIELLSIFIDRLNNLIEVHFVAQLGHHFDIIQRLVDICVLGFAGCSDLIVS